MVDFVEQREGNRLVESAEDGGIEGLGFQVQGKDLDFRNAVAGGKMQGFRRELVSPEDVGDLGAEEFLHPFVRRRGSMDAGLGNRLAEARGRWERNKERVIGYWLMDA